MTADLKAIATTLRSQADLLDPPVVVPPPVTPPTDTRFASVPTFFDDFTSGNIDKAIWWAPYDGVAGTGGVGMRRGSLCTIRDSQLVLAAERPNATSTDYNKWTSTGLAAGPKGQVYGRWEFRAKCSAGAGFWPNAQLWPTNEGWPKTIEVDIAEMPDGKRQNASATIHYGPNNSTKDASYQADFTQFHVWVVEWSPTAVVVYLDGKVVANFTDKALIPTVAHHIVFQTDMANGQVSQHRTIQHVSSGSSTTSSNSSTSDEEVHRR